MKLRLVESKQELLDFVVYDSECMSCTHSEYVLYLSDGDEARLAIKPDSAPTRLRLYQLDARVRGQIGNVNRGQKPHETWAFSVPALYEATWLSVADVTPLPDGMSRSDLFHVDHAFGRTLLSKNLIVQDWSVDLCGAVVWRLFSAAVTSEESKKN